jgi:ribosomal protein S18 acetylase RimI-like enzyme
MKVDPFSLSATKTALDLVLRDGSAEFFIYGVEEGFAQLRFRHNIWTARPLATLEDLYVVSDKRRRGRGTALLHAAIHHCRSLGCTRIELDVNETNGPAVALYTRLGFTAENPYAGGSRDYLMRHWLVPPEGD